MWYIILEGQDYKYEIHELLKLFIESDDIFFIDNKALAKNQGFLLICSIIRRTENNIISIKLSHNNKVLLDKTLPYEHENNYQSNRKLEKRMLKLCIYDTLSKFLNKDLPWGILTGIRPTKIVHEMMDKSKDIEAINNVLTEEYRISKDKIDLVMEVARNERPYLSKNSSSKISLYISIPFCPSRCLYCSFPSNPLGSKNRDIVNKYLEALLYEIKKVLTFLKQNGKVIECLYLGGGTPTTLTPEEFFSIFSTINKHFSLESIREITVEAGRPDTIDYDKLKVLKSFGVERISINPQTMNTDTLIEIGRSHTPQKIEDSMYLARDLGFKTINMDLIIGLPKETPEMVEVTMKNIEILKPENITVHTLAIKNASKLKEGLTSLKLPSENEVYEMLEITQNYSSNMGLTPYYMYRQKYMVGNLENIGYCLPGHECIYNIQIMEEKQTIIGLGSGAISKFYYPEENRLERVPNVTNLEQYINRIDEMVQRKMTEFTKL